MLAYPIWIKKEKLIENKEETMTMIMCNTELLWYSRVGEAGHDRIRVFKGTRRRLDPLEARRSASEAAHTQAKCHITTAAQNARGVSIGAKVSHAPRSGS